MDMKDQQALSLPASTLVKHLESRGMNTSLYRFFVGEEVVTFLLYNPHGKLVGYQQYRPGADKKTKNDPREGRYFTYLPREVDGFFGLEQDVGGPLFIVEGVFKAAKLHSLGYSAVAVLGASPKRLKSWFRAVSRQRRLFAIGDNDAAGAGLVKIVGAGIQSPKDLDEMTDEEVMELING